MINTIRNIFQYKRKIKAVEESIIQSQLNAIERLRAIQREVIIPHLTDEWKIAHGVPLDEGKHE